MDNNRFFVDERGGCIAVRDRNNTDHEYEGLHEDTEGVVGFWMGKRNMQTCPTCNHESMNGWGLDDISIFSAYVLCEKLNTQYGAS